MGGGTRRAFVRGKDTMTRPKGHVPLQSAPPLPPAPTAPVFKPPLVTLMTFLPAELLDAVEEVLPALLEQQVHVYLLADRCKTSHVDTFNDKMRRASGEPVPKELRSSVTLGSTAVYIYTSGTTGGCCGTGTCAPRCRIQLSFLLSRVTQSCGSQSRQSPGPVFALLLRRRDVQRCALHHPPPLSQRRLFGLHLSH